MMTLNKTVCTILLVSGMAISSFGGETDRDEELCRERFSFAVEQSLQTASIGKAVVSIGQSFQGTPYVAHTLEQEGEEQLVINLRGLDCVTFVENALTVARCVKGGQTSFEEYTQQLQFIRYRGGKIDGYPSRLHYFSDWIFDNGKKLVVRNVTQELGGEPYTKKIDFMSTHADAYAQLGNAENLRRIKAIEEEMRDRPLYYIPKSKVKGIEENLRDGDVIAITSSVPGLDIAHTGLTVRIDGTVKFLHAPLVDGVVQTTKESLSEYLAKHKKHTGIMVARPEEPARR